MDIYISDCASGGYNLYLVMVNGKVFDKMTATRRLTWSEQWDIVAGYKEALTALPHLIKD